MSGEGVYVSHFDLFLRLFRSFWQMEKQTEQNARSFTCEKVQLALPQPCGMGLVAIFEHFHYKFFPSCLSSVKYAATSANDFIFHLMIKINYVVAFFAHTNASIRPCIKASHIFSHIRHMFLYPFLFAFFI